ncbi:MAG: HlyD family efflux transporter periplasmic adaptor subunit, partial [Clostridiales bacterium]|nr:HlyD family efflux transporter periplasmic adaptor subunit [Clostridiales bacterium]
VGTLSNSLSFSGSLQLIDSKTYTASSASSVRALYVAEGQAVKKGDKLITLANGRSYTADFDGKVNVINYHEGDSVSSGAELLQIADFDHMKVSIRVDEYDISDVSVGENCRITTTATDQVYESTIASINYISSSTGSVAYYTATAYVDVQPGIYPGMQVTVTVPQEEASNVVILKMDALSFDETNRAFVYQMGEGEEMIPVYVETGVSNGNYVEIKSGLKANDTVYVQAKADTQSTMAGMFSSLFGSQQINNRNTFRNNTNTNRNPNNMPGSNYGPGSGR